ncbi:hypothetical protein LY90DRAFT_663979 [Neocallimastix californiae]|uniref:Uncharacterized protein n=1 Tax=Neocallimastix californiae TaxID=1754190 RepID=A0A1Y2FHT8_9FUNG|nr:hypothetical protein LY90DRAFT_663979 [Neocallimastix californiae]|eukprot:ORY82816.1 hypothetical protein LY90DRAFT_663979 [Neocallimastix californiae]
MLGPSAEESEMIATEHLHYLERLAKFSIDLNIYGIPIVQETFQKLVSMTGARRFLQRAEAFERFLIMLSRRTLNSNYYLNRQYYEDMNTHNVNMYGSSNYDPEFNHRVRRINLNPNINISLNPNNIQMNNLNSHFRQSFIYQRGIPLNENLNNTEKESEEEEEEEEENDHEERNNISSSSVSTLSSNNSEDSLSISLRDEYSTYTLSTRRQRSRHPSYENYISRVQHCDFQGVPSHISNDTNKSIYHDNNSDIKINEEIYQRNNHNHVSNQITDIRSMTIPNTTNNNNIISNTNTNIVNNNINDNNNAVMNSLNKEELKINNTTHRNINMKLYENLNMLKPATTDDDDIQLNDVQQNESHKKNENSEININNSEIKNIIITSSMKQQTIYNNNNIPKEEITETKDSSSINTINIQSDSPLNLENEKNNNLSENILKNDDSSSSYSTITIRNQNYDSNKLSRKRKYDCQTTTINYSQQKKIKQ